MAKQTKGETSGAKPDKEQEKGKPGDATEKSKNTKKGKKGKKGKTGGPSIATHPRAGAHVRHAKGYGGLGGFAIAGFLSLQAGVPPFDVGLRALVAGVVGYMLAWACSVTVWRHLVLAELRTLVEDGQLTPTPFGSEPPAHKTPDEDGS